MLAENVNLFAASCCKIREQDKRAAPILKEYDHNRFFTRVMSKIHTPVALLNKGFINPITIVPNR